MGKRRKDGSRKIYLTLIGFALASILILVAIDYLPRFATRGNVPPFEEIHHPPDRSITYEIPISPHGAAAPRIAIIIDDLGYDKSLAREFTDLDLPLTLSILPFTPYTRSIAHRAKREGREIMLHLPMEPRSYPRINPGDGVLLVSMERDTILEVLDRNLGEIPFVAGVNNHMGSRFTEDSELMRIVLKDIQKRDLFFLDSRTTPKTVGFELAKEMGIKTGQRNVFLDNNRDVSKIKTQIAELVKLSKRNGGAIGIGHPHPEMLQALQETIPSLRDNGIEVVPVSMLLE